MTAAADHIGGVIVVKDAHGYGAWHAMCTCGGLDGPARERPSAALPDIQAHLAACGVRPRPKDGTTAR